jgi:KUP system potassium uptake protein
MGDGAITPPISILGGLEGMAVAGEVPESVIVGLTLVILTILFAFQYKGTAVVGLSFGPIMLIWFGTIAYIGIVLIAKKPEVLMALNPYYGVKFLLSGGELHTKVHFMGAAMLALTGGEALYADLGHFSKNSVRTAFVVVFACLTCNYLGQAAFLMDGKK